MQFHLGLTRTLIGRPGILAALLLVLGALAGFGQSWTQLNDIGATITGSAGSSPPLIQSLCLSVNGKLYVFGSKTYTSNLQGAVTWEYDPASDSWMEKAPYPGLGWSDHCGFVIGNQLYVGGGWGQTNSNSDFFKYDPAADTWTAIASMGAPRGGAGAFEIGGKGYVLCGQGQKDLWEYNPATNSWTQKADFPGGMRYALTAFSCNGKGFAGLGFDSNTWRNDMYRYDPVADTWTASAGFPGTGRSYARAVVLGNNAVITCGNNAMTVFMDAFQSDCSSGAWSSLPPPPGVGRAAHVFGNAGNRLFFGGGNGAGGVTAFKDWWTIQSAVGMPGYALQKVRVTKNSSGQKVIVFETLPPAGTCCKVFDFQGRLISKPAITGMETVLPEDLHGIYLVTFEPPLSESLKVEFD